MGAVGDFPLEGKIVVVTGAGSGINLAFVRLAHTKGARIIIADLRLTKDAEDFLATVKDTVIFQPCDVTKRDDLETLITVSQNTFSDIPDVYVAGAGVFDPKHSNFWDDTEDDGYASLGVNLVHPIKLARIAIRELIGKDKPGVVLIIASMAGLIPLYADPLYSAAKHAMVGFARGMGHADELEGVRVAAICPGITDENSQTPEEVAVEMAALVEDGTRYPGGTILQTSRRATAIAPPPEGFKILKEIISGSIGLPGERLKGGRGALK
ncbi:hypothetical protein FGG08_005719 [Glutinoglossum americanum]|uniref:Uncharacterized protein n=1 Tax=Glutinoglossum americanum TaxID=1670608 RepID=A0A9P8I8V9_9PEZI|nr:hypothetical protein FGG08_005719 [Glutinoglossum americanum]